MNIIVCPQCGQSNVSKSKLDYCSFCYSRFADSESHEEADQEIDDAQQNESPVETHIQASLAEIIQFKGGHSSSICPACRQDVPWEERVCQHCQFEITEEWILQRIQFIRSQIKELDNQMPETSKKQGGHETSICPSCRHNIPWEETICPTCQFDLSRPWL